MAFLVLKPWLKTETYSLERRRGGRARARGRGGKKGKGGKDRGKKGGSAPSISVPVISVTGSGEKATAYGDGSTEITVIPAGQPFAGRLSGGGARNNIYGNKRYGSGYPGYNTPGVADRGFPFNYWPVVFDDDYEDSFHFLEYGVSDNSSRPGGPLFDGSVQPLDGANTYHILADNETIQSLVEYITANCSCSTSLLTPVPYNTSDPAQCKPEQVVQYYRASSIALALNGYNNSAVFSSDNNAVDTPLPSNVDHTFLDCLNQTIGAAAPLFGAASSRSHIPNLFGLAIVTLYLLF